MREARQVYRERKRWKYGVRSRYVVKPHLVDSLMVHWVHASKGRSREVVVPQSAGVLAHFRQRLPEGIQLTGERQVDPRLARLVAKVVGRVEQVCNHLKTCSFINTIKDVL